VSSNIRSDLHVPDEFGSLLDEFADICDGLVAACSEVASGSADLPAPSSPLASEASVFRATYPHAETNLEYGPTQGAATYVDSIRLQLASISALLRAREVVGSLWSIVRAELETAGRVAWILDPTIQQPAGEVRVARYYLEVISSLQRARFTTSKYDAAAAKVFKKQRDTTIAAAKDLFADFALELDSPEIMSAWMLHGEPLLGLGAGANLFAELCLSGPGKALYDILSDYSHPSLLSIELQTRLVDDGEVASHPWVVTPEIVEHQCRWACTILYKACQLVAAYMQVDASALERWADDVPAKWFSASA
jgi:hypothetical protein